MNRGLLLKEIQPTQVDSQLSHEFRSQMPVTQHCVYFDHAAVGPLSGPATTAIQSYVQQCSTVGDKVWPQWFAGVENTRQSASQLLGANSDEIALVHSTTEGITIVAEGLDWKSGDNVVVPANEFPANVYPWLNLHERGVEVRRVDMPVGSFDYQRLDDACDQRTRLVSVSWVGFADGYRICPATVAELAHRNGALFLLDAIQGLGVFPMDVKEMDIDFLSADGHKWLLGPEGAGIAYIRAELLDQLRPNIVGWNSVEDRYDFQKIEMQLRASAGRYEAGSQNMVGQLGLGGSLDMFLKLNINNGQLGQYVVGRTLHLKEQLKSLGAEVFDVPVENQTGILLFEIPKVAPELVRERLLTADIVSSCRGGRVRVAVHGYNQTSDFENLLEVVASIIK